MKDLTLELRVLEEGHPVKEFAVCVRPLADGQCQPTVFIKDMKSGFETTVKLPKGEHYSLRSALENMVDQKLDAAFVLGLLRKIGGNYGKK